MADTGPLVAIVRTREKAHRKCAATLKVIGPPLLTCWPVLAEAAWPLRKEPGGLKALGGMIESGLVKLVEIDETGLAWMIKFMDRYASAQAQMPDAALMYIAEYEGIDSVFTLDRRISLSIARPMAAR